MDDAALAGYLHKEFARAGHEVFIDMRMKVGIDWSAEITPADRRCEFLIVLLSEGRGHERDGPGRGAPRAPPPQAERHACHPASPGPPRGVLGYELSAYLGRLQYARWTGPADDRPVLEQLLEAIAAGGQACSGLTAHAPPLPPSPPVLLSVDLAYARPPIAADPRVLASAAGPAGPAG